jgi:hypothetical protein
MGEAMHKKFLKAAAFYGVAGGLVLLGMVLDSLYRLPFDKLGDVATWLGAVGAFAAFGGAIYLAMQQNLRSDRERIARARVFAPAVALQLTLIRPMLDSAIASLSTEGYVPLEMKFQNWGEHFKEIPIWSVSEMEAFICLPNDCAVSLALVKEIMRATSESMLNANRSKTVEETVSLLKGAADHAEVAARELQAVVEQLIKR